MFYTYKTSTQDSPLRDFGPYRIFITSIDLPDLEAVKYVQYGKIEITPKIKYVDRIAGEEEVESIEKKIRRLANQIPEDEWASLPQDLNENLDHYLYC